ncbi:MAG: hypothetical protein QXV17_10675 [Candidatus Micrarchaeaceae archaeon]
MNIKDTVDEIVKKAGYNYTVSDNIIVTDEEEKYRGKRVLGKLNLDSGYIYIYKNIKDRKEFMNVLMHEIAHYIVLKEFSGVRHSKKWRSIYEKLKALS